MMMGKVFAGMIVSFGFVTVWEKVINAYEL